MFKNTFGKGTLMDWKSYFKCSLWVVSKSGVPEKWSVVSYKCFLSSQNSQYLPNRRCSYSWRTNTCQLKTSMWCDLTGTFCCFSDVSLCVNDMLCLCSCSFWILQSRRHQHDSFAKWGIFCSHHRNWMNTNIFFKAAQISRLLVFSVVEDESLVRFVDISYSKTIKLQPVWLLRYQFIFLLAKGRQLLLHFQHWIHGLHRCIVLSCCLCK